LPIVLQRSGRQDFDDQQRVLNELLAVLRQRPAHGEIGDIAGIVSARAGNGSADLRHATPSRPQGRPNRAAEVSGHYPVCDR
jgi:hypothetical protein